MFDDDIICHVPLGTKDKLCNPDFPVPISLVYGANDWMDFYEAHFGKEVIRVNKSKFGALSTLTTVPDSKHVFQKENPLAYRNAIVNALTGENLPILSLE